MGAQRGKAWARPVIAVIAVAVALLAAGCTSASKSSSSTASTIPVAPPRSLHGALPGLQIYAVSQLSQIDRREIDMWQLKGEPADDLPRFRAKNTPLIDGHVLDATEDTDTANGLVVQVVTVHFDPEGTKALADATTARAGQKLAVVLNGQVLMAPTVEEPITSGQLVVNSDVAYIVLKAIKPAP